MNVGVYVPRAAKLFGDRPAVIDGARTLSFRGLDQRTNRLAHALAALGVGRSDRVALILPNSLEWIEAEFALTKAGAMTVPIGMRLHVQEMVRIIVASDVRAIITDAETQPRLAEALADTAYASVPMVIVGGAAARVRGHDYEDVIGRAAATPVLVEVDEERDGRVMRFTSGTTGAPKGVFLNHRNWLANAHGLLLDRCDLRRDDVVLACSGYSHAGGLWHVPALIRGAAIQVIDKFDPEQIIRHIERGGATVVQMVPTALRRLLDVPGIAGRKLERLRSIHYGGAPIEASTLGEALEVLGPKLVQGYGLNEACMVCTLAAEDHPALLDQTGWEQPMGHPTTLAEVRLAGPDGATVQDGAVGEIAIRGRLVFREYWRDPAATAAAIRDGWFYTGDLARCGERGELYLAGRSKDIIVTGGYNVSPAEVEAVLDRHPDVHQCAVVGLPHREWGEQVTAFVVAKQGRTVDADALIEFCRDRLTSYKKPKVVHFVGALPVNSNGKIMRRELRERFAPAARQ